MIEYQFLLDDIEVDEPIDFANLELSIVRDDETHGIGFESSTSALKFYGAAANYIRNAKETLGIRANVNFTAKLRCDEEAEFETLLSGRLNFGKFKESCGNSCIVTIPWENESCELVLNSKYEQKVDVDKLTGADNITALQTYAGLGKEIEVTAVQLLAAIDGSVADEGDVVDVDILNSSQFLARPNYSVERYNNIQTGQLTAASNYYSPRIGPPCISPQFLDEDDVKCFTGNFEYNVRTKGSFDLEYDVAATGLSYFRVRMILFNFEDNPEAVCIPFAAQLGDPGYDSVIHSEDISFVENAYGRKTGTFDVSWSGTIVVPEGSGLYVFVVSQEKSFSGTYFVNKEVTFDKETYFTLQAPKNCPSTTAKVYLIHETLSRVAENITNGCIRVKSSYYGRVDSEPFAFDQDGCGGLRAVTSGLYLRLAPQPNFFVSMKDLIKGLNPIDNIGMGVEPDTAPGKYILRIEDSGYFYQDVEIMQFLAIPDGDIDTEEQKNYSIIKSGYKTWEPEAINGLDEINGNREYRTTIETVNNTLDIESEIITGSYLIETTRQQSFASSGGADTSEDNSVFLFCLMRTMYDLIVEKGVTINDANIYSPSTIYNYRISPFRNLMRWYKTILSAFPQLNSDAAVFFNSGEANITARGELDSTMCKLENGPVAENQTLYITQYNNTADYLPIWKNETFTFEFPMSLKDYKSIKAAPYGYITYQCGANGPLLKGFIKEIKYRPAKGKATFILRKKYFV